MRLGPSSELTRSVGAPTLTLVRFAAVVGGLLALGCDAPQSDSTESEATDSADSGVGDQDTAPAPEGTLAVTNGSGEVLVAYHWWRDDGKVRATSGGTYPDGESWDFDVPAGTGSFQAWNDADACWAHEYTVADGETVVVEIGALTGTLDGSWCVMPG